MLIFEKGVYFYCNIEKNKSVSLTRIFYVLCSYFVKQYMRLIFFDPDFLIIMRQSMKKGMKYDFLDLLTYAGDTNAKGYPTKLSFNELEEKVTCIWSEYHMGDRYIRDSFVFGKAFHQEIKKAKQKAQKALRQVPTYPEIISKRKSKRRDISLFYLGLQKDLQGICDSLNEGYCAAQGFPMPASSNIATSPTASKQKDEKSKLHVSVQSDPPGGSKFGFSPTKPVLNPPVFWGILVCLF
uniref:Uncharacterized protein n=1 Tax=Rhipiliopsis peltata TaxID=2320810 RepID=A0A386B194_9CHLO|nr:hypothetical protein [Rhipiliopsis peltata]AYC65474.1 hypothetical protein [Rhipiliopsis peltata]